MSQSLSSTVVWQGGDLPLMEMATLWRTDDGYALSGTVVGSLADAPLAARYRVECTSAWDTRTVWVELTRPTEVLEIRAEVSSAGTWTVNGSRRAELDGLRDVDIQVTPSTNTLPIRRLALGVGAEAEVTAARIHLPDLSVSPLTQSYRRVGAREYEYRSGDFRAHLTVDGDGLVVSYGSFWRRLGVLTPL